MIIFSNTSTHFKKTRSFVKREGRLTPRQKNALEQKWSEYVLPSDKPLSLLPQPTIIEIGFGMGRSLLTTAERYPEKNFIGIEVHRPGIGALIAELSAKKIENVRVFYDDANEVINRCVPDNSIDEIDIFFPDPWPKRRHNKRRLIQTPFIELLTTKLKKNGILHLATDWEEYAIHMMQVLSNIKVLKNTAGPYKFAWSRGNRPLTKYEQRGERLGHEIWDLIFVIKLDSRDHLLTQA